MRNPVGGGAVQGISKVCAPSVVCAFLLETCTEAM